MEASRSISVQCFNGYVRVGFEIAFLTSWCLLEYYHSVGCLRTYFVFSYTILRLWSSIAKFQGVFLCWMLGLGVAVISVAGSAFNPCFLATSKVSSVLGYFLSFVLTHHVGTFALSCFLIYIIMSFVPLLRLAVLLIGSLNRSTTTSCCSIIIM